MTVGSLIQAAVRGAFPVGDGLVHLLPKPTGAHAAIVSFTNHVVVAADIEPSWLDQHLAQDDIVGAAGPSFTLLLEKHIGVASDGADLVMAAAGSTTSPELSLQQADNAHPRLERARRVRSDVRAFGTANGDGLVVIGRGLDGRWEVSVEVDPHSRSRGLGKQLALAARTLVAPDEFLFAQVAPGNVQSLRMLLATGFAPVASEILFLGATETQ